MGKLIDFIDDLVEFVDLGGDLVAEFRAEVGVFVALWEKLGEGFDGDKRVADFVAHAGGQFVPECGPFELFFLFLKELGSCDVMKHHHGTDAFSTIHQAACLSREGSLGTCNLTFTNSSLAAVASHAKTKGTGARGLRAILEQVMLEIMYDVPQRSDIKKCRITKSMLEKTPVLFTPPTKSDAKIA